MIEINGNLMSDLTLENRLNKKCISNEPPSHQNYSVQTCYFKSAYLHFVLFFFYWHGHEEIYSGKIR